MQSMKKINIFILSFMLLFFPIYAFSNTIKEIKLAIFDNPEIDTSEPSLTENAKKPYEEGIETAIYVAHKKGIHVTKKEFFYGNNLLGILQQAPNVKSWRPDAIIGLHSSNSALMANSLFTDNLVLSISASDMNLPKISANFYSLGTPDRDNAKQMVDFISEQYPHKNLFLIIGADGKESVDLGNLVSALYKKKNPKQTVNQSEFLSDDASTMDISSLVKGYKSGDIIIFFAISRYNAQIKLMNKIADFLVPNKLIFMTAVDNWKNHDVMEDTNNTVNPYTALRFDTSSIDRNSKNYNYFAQNFEKIYHRQPVDNISFITYQTVMSIVTALGDFPPPKGLSTKQAILWSYKKAIKHDPDWFRFLPIVVYKAEGNKEVFFTSLPEKHRKQ